jgi:hypothetical protein
MNPLQSRFYIKPKSNCMDVLKKRLVLKKTGAWQITDVTEIYKLYLNKFVFLWRIFNEI